VCLSVFECKFFIVIVIVIVLCCRPDRPHYESRSFVRPVVRGTNSKTEIRKTKYVQAFLSVEVGPIDGAPIFNPIGLI